MYTYTLRLKTAQKPYTISDMAEVRQASRRQSCGGSSLQGFVVEDFGLQSFGFVLSFGQEESAAHAMQIMELQEEVRIVKETAQKSVGESLKLQADLDVYRDKEAFLRGRGDHLFQRALDLSKSLGDSRNQEKAAGNFECFACTANMFCCKRSSSW